MKILDKYIINPAGDFIARYIKKSWGEIISRKPKKQTTITREELVDLLMDWKKEHKPESVAYIGATDYYRYLCDKLNLL
ncbi:hypothetical protein LCGC14_1071750 [marine sediment metagenome]|uniref:Uncharacterized protein n=1 Tax=marine sediment metagenome TaxID=412755 RepID=A0A0F9MHZ4_9ZZZZ